MSLLPEISQASAEINKLVAQANIHQTIAPVDPAAFTDPADTALLASRDPVIREVSVGMTGEAYSDYSVSGTPPLSLTNSLGKPLKAWSVDLSPYQEGSGDPSPDNVRPIHGTDKVTIYTDSKYGGLVEWNQLLRNGNFENTSNWSASASSFTVSNSIVTVTKNENTVTGIGYIWQTAFRYVVGHKYFATIDYKGIAGKQLTVFSNSASAGMEQVIPADSEWHTLAKIFDVSGTPSVPSIVWLSYATTVGDNVAYFRNYNICDLTQMFGAGNEPSTVEEFRALFPKDYYAYNAGQQMTVDQVNGAQYSPSVLTLPQTVYTGTIGSEGGESRTRMYTIASVSSVGTSSAGVKYANVGVVGSVKNNGNVMCESYKPSNDAATDNSVRLIGTTLYVYDNRFTDLATAQSLLIGLKVLCELATPTTFAVPSVSIPTPTGTATTWATAEDGTVESMEVTYVGKA